MGNFFVEVPSISQFWDKIKIHHRVVSPFPATIRHTVRSPFISTVGLTIFHEGVKCLCTLVNLGPAGSSSSSPCVFSFPVTTAVFQFLRTRSSRLQLCLSYLQSNDIFIHITRWNDFYELYSTKFIVSNKRVVLHASSAVRKTLDKDI